MSKRNHHLQPNFYLKGFCSNPDEKNPKVWVYERDKPFYDGKTEQLQNPKHRTTEKVARKRDFYATVREDGTKDYEKYEDLLRDNFEEPAKPIIEKIKKFEAIDEDEKSVLARYVASMITRGEHGKFISEHSMELAIKQNFDANPNLPGSVLREAENQILKLKESGEIFKEQIISKALLIESYIVKMNWKFYTAPKNLEYFTSDNPVFSSQLSKEDGEVIFPVSSNVSLYCSRQKTQDRIYENASDYIVEKTRDIIARICISEVYFSQKREWLVKFINNR